MAGRPSRKGRLAPTILFASMAALVAAGGGCGIAIGGAVPDFECLSNQPAVCPGSEVCDPVSHQCVAPCSATGCKGGLVCDPSSNTCVAAASDDGPSNDETSVEAGDDGDATTAPDEAAPPVETGPETGPCNGIGCPCSGASNCSSGICADQLSVTSGLWSAAGSTAFCTQPCCTSTDCPSGSVCFATAAGGNYCVEPQWLQRSTVLGAAAGGATCATGRDCRSGLCPSSGFCADTCCSTSHTSECAGGDVCRFGTFPGVAGFDKSSVGMCGQGGSGSNGSACTRDSDCQSELCDSTSFGNCRDMCRNTADCGGGGVSCAYITVGATTGIVAACFPQGGSTPEGSSCSQDSDCQSQFCDPTSKECTDVCFANSDCTKAGWRCRPQSVTVQGGGSYSVLACGT